MLYLRIYLIPWDLPHAHGRLRMRDTSIINLARKYLNILLPKIVQDDRNWEGEPSVPSSRPRQFLEQEPDNRQMAEIYSSLPSPTPDQRYLEQEIPGLRSTLYRYQRRTVATMLSRELQSSTIPDPLYVAVSGIDGSIFYLQPASMEVLCECPKFMQVRGGILCEELGTGKTVMMLALILATLGQLPEPEESILDPRPVMTPLSFRHFPFAACVTARKQISHGSGVKQKHRADAHRIPSLVEILLHYCRVQPNGLYLQQYQELLEQRCLWDSLVLNVPFYYHYEMETQQSRSSRRQRNLGPKVMYLSSATLVVVPKNLFHQWKNEIMKHCHDTLRCLEVDRGTTLPSVTALASEYDIRWKRLVIDEGHVAGTMATNLTPFSKLLSVERKWIVTGTPTTNLLGLSFGQGTELQYPEKVQETWVEDFNEDVIRKWTQDDREDLNKLQIMVIHFLGVPQFAMDSKRFDFQVIQPLLNSTGPCYGAIQILTQVMHMIMIRHQIEDVEQDVLLPLLQQEIVLLDLDFYALKTYNVMQATIAINAVDSERTDQDYLFHPRNVAALLQLVNNISQAMFWHIDDEKLFRVEEMAKSAEKFLQTAQSRQVPSQDLILMQQSIIHIKSAASDGLWQALQAHANIFHRVYNMPSSIYQAWAPFSDHALQVGPAFLNSERLQSIRSLIRKQPLTSQNHIIAWGRDVNDEERHRQTLHHSQLHMKKRSKRDNSFSVNYKKQSVMNQSQSMEKLKEMQQEYIAVQKRLEALFKDDNTGHDGEDDINISGTVSGNSTHALVSSSLLHLSPLANVHIGNSTSSKLDYILAEVIQYSSTEKFLIFSESALTLAYIAEGLDLIQTKYLQFTTEIKPKMRELLVTIFETSDLYRVLLMELKHGARGLNLVTASRVIFCEPVWKADVETQAIKRVHRIGQTRPVTVKTLAIRSTFEEVMVNRREALKSNSGKQSNLTDDRRIRDFLANPTFLPETSPTRPNLDIRLFNIPQRNGPTVSSIHTTHTETTQDDQHISHSSSKLADLEAREPFCKKRRVVRFADDTDED
ncbi:hypothetical protein AcW2_004861 [Taiwanofungus camphoratus]|nr:hypothetical protein AcW2_004861 [Antrodia cinnamomea]